MSTDGDYLLSQPYLALGAAMAVMVASGGILIVASRFDNTGGILTLAIIITVAFIVTTFASLIYNVQQTPLTEILVGGLSTALGAVVAYWMGRDRGDQTWQQHHNPPPNPPEQQPPDNP